MNSSNAAERLTQSYIYTDGQNHRLTLRTATDTARRSYVWVEAENLAVAGDVVAMWLTPGQAADLDAALGDGRLYRAADHTGDTLTVDPGNTWTTFEVTRQANDDDPAATVRVVVLTGRVSELRQALMAAAQFARQRAAGDVRKPRVLTPGEHDRAWHAIEGAAGAPGADPGTILRAVLTALGIEAPSAEDEQAASAAMRARRAGYNWPHRGL
ncbi:hypothetical protein [Streptomyces sp. NPDC046976]|uniref:hypothetical protein n=1 Tax=Streptomyces sp. NPDC046976 TaxID=3155258 RepID=UPI0033C0ECEC